MPVNPGSAEAKRIGCTCPVLDNAYGQGAIVDRQVQTDKFYLDPGCPIHVDKRRVNAQSGGEGDSGGAGGDVLLLVGDDSIVTTVEEAAGLAAGEGASVAPLSGTAEGRANGQEGGGTPSSGEQGTGPSGQGA